MFKKISEHLSEVTTSNIDQTPAHLKRAILSTEKYFLKNTRSNEYLKTINNRRNKPNKLSAKQTKNDIV